MSVKKDASGRRWVQVEVEVPGTPEEVWKAIATGPGVSSWFVPTEVEERQGVPIAVRSNFGPGMESVATVSAWDPPHRFAADSEDLGPGAPPVATEWIVEARAGGICIVRVVHSLFATSDDWDNQLEMWEGGWPGFFRILRLYLTHFRSLPCAALQVGGAAPLSGSQAWATLTRALGLVGAAKGAQVSTARGAPRLGGVVEAIGQEPHAEELLLRLAEPAPGIAHLFAMAMGPQAYLSIRLYLYGAKASAVVAREEPTWRAWLDARFPAAGTPTEADAKS